MVSLLSTDNLDVTVGSVIICKDFDSEDIVVMEDMLMRLSRMLRQQFRNDQQFTKDSRVGCLSMSQNKI